MLELEPRPTDFRDCATLDGEQAEKERTKALEDMRMQYADSVIDDAVHMDAVRRTVRYVDGLVAEYGRAEAERRARDCWGTWLKWERLCRPRDSHPDEGQEHHGLKQLASWRGGVRPPRDGNELLAREIVDDPAMRGQWWMLPGLNLEEDEIEAELRLWHDMPVRDGRYRFETMVVRRPHGMHGMAVMLPD